ncbi:unannotated protein [freshwater metagenome]|uniref:Unannotated protein n=1 Tax=freshwater metagenome TaxID=449393 RepID=A0A6J7CL54_9ZZZZ
MIPTSHFSSFVAKANTGVGNGLGKTKTSMPAPLIICAVSVVKSSEPCRASRPMTTECKSRSFIYMAIAAAVRPTTARFIPEGPGRTGPRSPAVPNCKKP